MYIPSLFFYISCTFATCMLVCLSWYVHKLIRYSVFPSLSPPFPLLVPFDTLPLTWPTNGGNDETEDCWPTCLAALGQRDTLACCDVSSDSGQHNKNTIDKGHCFKARGCNYLTITSVIWLTFLSPYCWQLTYGRGCDCMSSHSHPIMST